MSRNRLNVVSLLLQGRSRVQALRRSLRMALQRLAPMNPSRWLVTAARYPHVGFLAIRHGRQLDVLLVMQIWRHCGVYASSRSSTVTGLAVAVLAPEGFSRPLQ